MKVLKLVAAVLLSLLPLWLLIWYANCRLFNFADTETVYQVWNRDIVRNKEALARFDTIILGDSIANSAYAPEYMSYSTLNLAVSAAGPVVNYYILEHFIENGGHPKAVFITFYNQHMDWHNIGNLYEKVFRSHLLRAEEEYEILQKAEQYNDKDILIPSYHTEWLSYHLGLPDKSLPAMLNAGLNGRKESNWKEYYRIDSHRGNWFSWNNTSWNNNYAEKHAFGFNVSPIVDEYFNRIFALCKEKGIAVKLVYNPWHPCITNQPDLKKKDEYFDALARKYGNVEIVRDLQGFDGEDFIDTHHMNVKGALKFSRMIRERFPDIFSNQHHDRKDLQGMEEYFGIDDKLDSLVYRLEPPFAGVVFKRAGIAYEPEKHVWNNLPVEHVSPSTALINGKGITVREKGAGIEVRFGDKKDEVRELGIGNQADLFLLVINMQTHRVVTEKRFVDKKSTFALVQ